MKKIAVMVAAGVVAGFLLTSGAATAGDLDDGISKYTEDSVSKYDELGKPDKNITFKKLDAKSRAKVREKAGIANGTASGTGSGSGNMNSVVLGAGGVVKGDIIIIDESRGDKTQIVE